MIIDACSRIRKFIDFINAKKLTDVPCEIAILVANGSVCDEDDIAFAVYFWGKQVMYVAGDLSYLAEGENMTEEDIDRVIFENMAHEYIHHLQYVRDGEPDEEEAERTARGWAEEYFGGDEWTDGQ